MKRPEPTRVREQGTHVTLTSSPEERMAAIFRIVERCQYEKVDGCMVDLFTASVIKAVYEAVSVENKALLAGMTVQRMATVCLKVSAKAKRP